MVAPSLARLVAVAIFKVKIQIEFQSSAICHITNDYIDDNSATIYNDVLRSRLQSRQMNNIKAG